MQRGPTGLADREDAGVDLVRSDVVYRQVELHLATDLEVNENWHGKPKL